MCRGNPSTAQVLRGLAFYLSANPGQWISWPGVGYNAFYTTSSRMVSFHRGCVGFDATQKIHFASPFPVVVGPPTYGGAGGPNIPSSRRRGLCFISWGGVWRLSFSMMCSRSIGHGGTGGGAPGESIAPSSRTEVVVWVPT